ncbi:sTim1 [Perkinsela sp. CCAP 1560/4]|nr:sTim1 [Perkinsela sp. CCAP 1560/4]|eukprot:KNH02451.1 sTim1 [Perkinsela sp. CCAP 1560/4]
MERLPPPQVPGLPPMPALTVSGINEKLYTIGEFGQTYCFQNCVGYFAEDSIPYHYGEKTCYERCLSKLHEGFHLSRKVRKDIESRAKDGTYLPSWIQKMSA